MILILLSLKLCLILVASQDSLLTSGLILYHKYDKGAGENATFVKDFSGMLNSGYVSGATWAQTGKFAGAFNFDGFNDKISVNDNPKLSIKSTGKLSISFWVKFNQISFEGDKNADGSPKYYTHIMGKGGPSNNQYAFRFYSNNHPERPNRISFYVFNLNGGLGAGSYVQEPVKVGEWMHIVGRCDGITTQIWKNGIKKDEDPLSGYNIIPQDGASKLQIGTFYGSSYFKGSIDELRVYNKALTAETISAIYKYVGK